MIEVKGLKKQFGDTLIWQGVNLTINKGDCVSIIGPSGCGKTTLLRCMNLLEQPTEGSVFIDGVDITDKNTNIDEIRKRMGMVYQSFNLFSHKTALENVIMGPMLLQKMNKKQAIALGMECLSMVGLGERADYMPQMLSGGQKQRVAIARCLAMKPQVILFDEPTSALDPTMVDEVLSVIRALAKDGMTCVIVTHEMEFARSVSSKIVYMDEKCLYEQGTPKEIFENPKRENTRIFIKRIKTLEYTITTKDYDVFGLNGQIKSFGAKHALTSRQIYGMQLVTEELLTNLLLPTVTAEIHLLYGYNDRENKAEITIAFGGDAFNPLEMTAEDDLSQTIIANLTKESSYIYKNDTNMLRIQL